MMYGKPARASHAVCEGSMIWLTHGKISGVFRLIAAIAFSSFPSMSCASSASSTPTTPLGKALIASSRPGHWLG